VRPTCPPCGCEPTSERIAITGPVTLATMNDTTQPRLVMAGSAALVTEGGVRWGGEQPPGRQVHGLHRAGLEHWVSGGDHAALLTTCPGRPHAPAQPTQARTPRRTVRSADEPQPRRNQRCAVRDLSWTRAVGALIIHGGTVTASSLAVANRCRGPAAPVTNPPGRDRSNAAGMGIVRSSRGGGQIPGSGKGRSAARGVPGPDTRASTVQASRRAREPRPGPRIAHPGTRHRQPSATRLSLPPRGHDREG